MANLDQRSSGRKQNTKVPKYSWRNLDPTTRHRRFAQVKFRWLKQLALDRKLTVTAFQVALWLCGLFDLDQNGTAEIYQGCIATDLDLSRCAVNRGLKLLVDHGHIRAIRQGRDRPNRYEMAFDVRSALHHKGHDVAAAATYTQILLRSIAHKKEEGGATNLPGFDQLLKIWGRPHSEDVPECQLAYVQALKIASPDDILQGAKAWAAAHHNRMFYLKALHKWLHGRCWELPPPKPPKNQTRRRHHSNGSAVDEMFKLAGRVQ
jgi:hypothetical protein